MNEQNELRGPTRIVFNFAYRCNMDCQWCYVPFEGRAPELELCRRIITRIAELGFKVLTLGGGDPMMYPFLFELVASAKKSGLFVHVDTNGISLQCTDAVAEFISTGIDLLGLPLDGPRPEIHNQMRSTRSHFELIVNRLSWLSPYIHKVKINTFVSKCNVEEIPEMVPLINRFAPSRWSLYQYWPLSLGQRATTQHLISDAQFAEMTERLEAIADHIRVEINALPSRKLTYPFVSHEGLVYVHDDVDQSKYKSLGQIFDDRVMSSIFASCGSERENAESRYRLRPK
jgi:MoaA/NifB/PqqE/SkfB family radical SAM enzyme